MKKFTTLLFLFICMCFTGQLFAQEYSAWVKKDGSTEHVLLLTPGYFTYTVFDKDNKKFISSWGGTYIVSGNTSASTIKFNTADQSKVGKTETNTFSSDNNELTVNFNGNDITFTNLDGGNEVLAGAWRISARDNNGSMQVIEDGPRKTIKILSGTRFQWIAMNTSTGEFFGTGGGTYSLKDGKYTETIEFFSRDSSRIGMNLTFDAKVDGAKWEHSGQSSKGDKIKEEWSRFE
jgi:hypothetical protein